MKKHTVGYLRKIPAFLSFISIAIASTVLTGWLLDNAKLKTFITGSIPMNPLTAVGFLILSGCILLLYTRYANMVRILGLVVASIGLVKLLSWLSGVHIPIDQQLFHNQIANQHPPSTIAPNTAFNFLLTGISMVLVTSPKIKRAGMIANSLSLITVFLALVALNGYLYDIRTLYGVGAFVPMAFPTAFCFLLLSSSLLIQRPQAGFLRLGMQKSLLQSHYLRPVHFVAFLTIPTIFLVVNSVSYRNTKTFVSSRHRVDSAYQNVASLDRTLQLLQDAETGQRGYLLTGEQRYLEPYDSAVKDLPVAIEQLKSTAATANNGLIDKLSSLSKDKLAELQQTINLRRKNQAGQALAIVLTNRGKDDMDQIRDSIAKLKDDEYKLLQQSKLDETSSGSVTALYIAIGTVLNLALLTGLYILLIRQLENSRQEQERVEDIVRKRTAELKIEQVRLQSSVDSLTTGFVMTDTEQKLLILNETARRLLGITRNDQSNTTFDDSDLRHALEATVQDKKVRELPERVVGERILRIIIAPVIQNARVIGAVVNIIDISEQKALDRSRDEFFSIASHELRTPLTVIRGNIRMILDMYTKIITDKDVLDMLEDMNTASERLIETVNAFLDMSSLEQNKQIYNIVPVNILDLVQKAIETFRPLASSNVKVKSVGEIDYFVEADEVRLKQILNILLNNAVKFTDKGSVIIRTERQADKLIIRVQDSGKGIKKDRQYLLFHKFQQASENILTRDSTHSIGLGLYIARMLAEGMHGKLELEASEEGKGSVFCLTLPAVKVKT
jgi:signal transduction histidine kinase